MSDFNTHFSKYGMFKTDAENESTSTPTRIDAYFYAAFHFIEGIAAKKGLHIEKHQKVRTILEKYYYLFMDKTEQVWRAFHEIENQIRPGQIYGGAVNGKKLQKTKELFQIIETICLGMM